MKKKDRSSEESPPDVAREGSPRFEPEKASRGTLIDEFSFIANVADRRYEDRLKLEPLVDEEGERIES